MLSETFKYGSLEDGGEGRVAQLGESGNCTELHRRTVWHPSLCKCCSGRIQGHKARTASAEDSDRRLVHGEVRT